MVLTLTLNLTKPLIYQQIKKNENAHFCTIFFYFKDNSPAGVRFFGGFIRDNLKIFLPRLSTLILIKNFFCLNFRKIHRI